MNNRDKIIVALMGLLLVALVLVWVIPTGLQQAPDIALNTIDGRTLKLKELEGRPLIVTFWATTCPGCIKEIPHLIDLYNELGPRGLEIIGIAMYYDPPNQVVRMSKFKNIPYPIALDINADAARAFGDVRLTPTNFLIAPDGRIIRHKIGEFSSSELAAVHDQIIDMLAETKG